MADKLFKVQVICPDRIFYDGECDMLELRTTEGDIGILAGHIPLTAVIAPGALRIMKDGETKEAALHDGFIEILQDRVVILAETCEWPDEIDLNRAKEAQIRAERRIKGADEIDLDRAEVALRKALLRITMAGKS
ncbi:MAG: ATP synthase F1 subunit epsilon [Velocimicrobium sp.]